jgi:thiamine biosynthesis lipoprotein
MGVVQLRGGSLCSSGDYLQSFSPDRRHHHIIDPRTGHSPEATSGCTVKAGTAMYADALATAVFVLGPDAGVALLNRIDGVGGMLVTKDGKIQMSVGFEALAV